MIEKGVRLNKYISESGFCSRREADKLIENGRVLVNKQPAVMGLRILPGDEVCIDGKAINKSDRLLYIAFNKPVGITCTTDLSVKGNIISYINHPERIFPIGRLDKPSEGLIFLTNDGDIVNKILRAGNGHEKEYMVWVDKEIAPDFVEKMSNGLPILETTTMKCKVEKLGKNLFRIVLKQGLNRQIRRMCEHLGYEVVRLKRIRIINMKIENLLPGKWREFTEAELSELKTLLADSVQHTDEHSYIDEID